MSKEHIPFDVKDSTNNLLRYVQHLPGCGALWTPVEFTTPRWNQSGPCAPAVW